MKAHTIDYYRNLICEAQAAKTAEDLRGNLSDIEVLIRADKSLNNQDYDDLMMDISQLYRESYRLYR